MFDSPIEWGKFIRATDPWANFTDALMENYKEGVAYYLADRERKQRMQMEREAQRAIEQYNQFKMFIDQAKLDLERQQFQEQLNLEKPKAEALLRKLEAETEQIKRETELLGKPKVYIRQGTGGLSGDSQKIYNAQNIINTIDRLTSAKTISPQGVSFKDISVQMYKAKSLDDIDRIAIENINKFPKEGLSIEATQKDVVTLQQLYKQLFLLNPRLFSSEEQTPSPTIPTPTTPEEHLYDNLNLGF